MAYRKGFRRGSDRHAGTSSSSRSYGPPGSASRASAPTHSPDRRSHTVGPTEHYQDRIQNIAAQNQRTSDLRNRAADQGFHQFLTPRDQIAKKTLGMRLSGLGGLLGGIGRGALSFFGGIPGKALSGIMTAKNWAKQKGTGVLQGIGEFGDTDEEGNPLYPTWDRFINRNTGKYDDKPYLGQGQSNYTFDDQVTTNVTNPNLNLNTIDATDPNYIPQNIPSEEELLNTPTFAAEGGRIVFVDGGIVRLL
jgi:hypothetical protein